MEVGFFADTHLTMGLSLQRGRFNRKSLAAQNRFLMLKIGCCHPLST